MKFEKFNLSGKNALITGAAGLLGVEHASALLECGAGVILTDISKDNLDSVVAKLSNEFPKNLIYPYLMDVTNLSSVQEIGAILERQSISVDILVNNAAIDPKVSKESAVLETSRLEYFPDEQWRKQIDVGLTGAFYCCQVFGTAMAKRGNGGVILNISSDLSVFAPDQRLYFKQELPDNLQPVKPITYSVIKTGLVGMTRYLATYWADKGVRSNALSPGGVLNGQGDEFIQRVSNLIPLARMANRDEYRAAVQFLCSDASSYMNGQNIVIDGGRSAW